MDSDYHQRYDRLFQGNQLQQQQSQMGSGLTRFRSAPSSFFANLLDKNFCEDILNRPSSPETERILVRLMSGDSGGGDGGSPLPQRVEEPEMKAEARDFVPSQQQGQGYYQRQSGSSQQQQQPDVGNRDLGFGGTSQAGMDRFGQSKQGSSLTRHSSSPAGLFADINIDESGMEMESVFFIERKLKLIDFFSFQFLQLAIKLKVFTHKYNFNCSSTP